ncbi:hypothetical protein PORCAN_689 [Porphyromonas crevioricanis JCM 13913]|nr:hypothetical protein PORCAN_689 [Porphyromonas crevioricanis JCM 13913]
MGINSTAKNIEKKDRINQIRIIQNIILLLPKEKGKAFLRVSRSGFSVSLFTQALRSGVLFRLSENSRC